MQLPGAISYEWMGLFALGVLWINTLLIAVSALGRWRMLGDRRVQLVAARAGGELVKGVVERGEGPDGALAARHVEQLGRALTTSGPDRILFTDRTWSTEIYGGVLRADDGGSLPIEARAGDQAEVWIESSAPSRDADEFDRAWSSASTNKGHATSIDLRIERGATVWVHRDRERDVVLVATRDPIALCDGRRARLAGFAVSAVILCALVTGVACWPPVFGVVSTIGGALALAFFLIVQPLGTAARDAAKLPGERPVGGLWQRPTS